MNNLIKKGLLILSFLISVNVSAVDVDLDVLDVKGTINEVKTILNQAMNSASMKLDYATASAILKALKAIEAIENTGDDLLDSAFSNLDDQSKQLFRSAASLLDEAGNISKARVDEINDASESVVNAVESSLIGTGESYILRYSPKIVPIDNQDDFQLTMRGVNLDIAEPKLHIDGQIFEGKISGPNQVLYTLPKAALKKSSDNISFTDIKVQHKTKTGSILFLFDTYADIERTLTLSKLPTSLGSYKTSFFKEENVRVSSPYKSSSVEFKGAWGDHKKVVYPKEGYFWDIREEYKDKFKIRHIKQFSKYDKCMKIDWNESTKDGITIAAWVTERLTKKSGGKKSSKPGFVECNISGMVFQEQKKRTLISESDEIALSWIDVEIEKPIDYDSYTLTVKTFDGDSNIVIGQEFDNPYFKIVESPSHIREYKKICVTGILLTLMRGYMNAYFRQINRSVAGRQQLT